MSRAEIVVDVAAIRHNLRRLAAHTGTAVMAVVKADGYGHGMLAAPRAGREAGRPCLGVATLDEALTLRDAGDVGHVLCWLTVPADDLLPAVARGVDVTAYTVAELDRLPEAAPPARGRALRCRRAAPPRRGPPPGRAARPRPAQDRHRPLPRRVHPRRLARPGGAR